MNAIMKATLVRAMRTVCQTVATIDTAAVFSAIDWRMVASASALASSLSVLTSHAMGLLETGDE